MFRAGKESSQMRVDCLSLTARILPRLQFDSIKLRKLHVLIAQECNHKNYLNLITPKEDD